eukprot:4861191-Prymnesium_polylepis.1
MPLTLPKPLTLAMPHSGHASLCPWAAGRGKWTPSSKWTPSAPRWAAERLCAPARNGAALSPG